MIITWQEYEFEQQIPVYVSFVFILWVGWRSSKISEKRDSIWLRRTFWRLNYSSALEVSPTHRTGDTLLIFIKVAFILLYIFSYLIWPYSIILPRTESKELETTCGLQVPCDCVLEFHTLALEPGVGDCWILPPPPYLCKDIHVHVLYI